MATWPPPYGTLGSGMAPLAVYLEPGVNPSLGEVMLSGGLSEYDVYQRIGPSAE